MDKEQQIEKMAFIALENVMTYTCAKQIAINFYNAGYRKIDENCVVMTRDDLKLYKKYIIGKFVEMLTDDFVKSAENQELSTVKGVLKLVCPAKVNKIKKRFLKESEN